MPLPPRPLPAAGPDPAGSGIRLLTAAAGLLSAAIVLGFLYFGRDVLIPLALTTLISFALGPLVSWLRRFVGMRTAVTLAVLFAVLLAGGIAVLLVWQIADLAANLPKYRTNLLDKMEDLRGGGGLVAEAIGAVRDLAADLTRPPPGFTTQPPEPKPMPVEIARGNALEVMASYLMPVVLPLLTAGLVIVLVVFMLLEREPLRDRLIRLVSRGDISRTTGAINDAVTRLSRFLANQVLINLGFGTVVGTGLWLIGMPNPLIWGILAAVLRFVPYVGSVVTAVVPTLMAIAVAPGWTLPILTFGLILVCELVVGQVVEPLRYSSSTGMSPLAVLVSITAWAALWGPIGMLLAMPLTVCLIVVGRHVPQLSFLEVVLGDEPVLPVEVQIYHRLLAHSPVDALEIAVEYAREHGVIVLYDRVLLPMLVLAENDRRRAALDSDRRQLIVEGVKEIIEAVAEEPDNVVVSPPETAEGDLHGNGQAEAQVIPGGAVQVFCIGGRSELDVAAALATADVLRRRQIAARALALGELAGAAAGDNGVDSLVLCVVMPGSATVIEHLVRRVREQVDPGVPITVAAFSLDGPPLATASLQSMPIVHAFGALGEVTVNALGREPALQEEAVTR